MDEGSRHPETGKEIAWNGVRFLVPAAWEPDGLEVRRLRLSRDGRPVMEAKWAPIKGRFHPEAQFRKLAWSQDRRARKALSRVEPPESWAKALAGFDILGFDWEGAAAAGRGVLLHCPECGTASLIQFFDHPAFGEETAAEVLASFRDHREDDRVLWSVFDIRAETDRRLVMSESRFDPGRFQLTFSARRETLRLFRWGPASALLRGWTLTEFGKNVELPAAEAVPTAQPGGPAVQWFRPAGAPSWSRPWRYLRKPRPQFVRLWQVEEKNRILGVSLSSNRPVDPQAAEAICRGFEAV